MTAPRPLDGTGTTAMSSGSTISRFLIGGDDPAVPAPAASPDAAYADYSRGNNSSTCRSLQDSFEWPSDFVAGLSDDEVDELAESMNSDTSSSAFSGIGTPEVAAIQLHRAVQARVGPDRLVQRPKPLYAIEWDADCQKELNLILQDTGDVITIM